MPTMPMPSAARAAADAASSGEPAAAASRSGSGRVAGIAAVIGAGGGIGGALVEQLRSAGQHAEVVAIGRRQPVSLDLEDEASIAAAADRLPALSAGRGEPIRLVVVATGLLHGDGAAAEKSWRELDAGRLTRVLAVNTVGPALLMKHFLPLLPRPAPPASGGAPAGGRAVFAVLSAKVGSIGDNRLGGWYGYRASKAALNQLVRCAAIELRRGRPQAICVALHPGTVDTALSRPFAKSGLEVRTPADAASRLLGVIDRLSADDSGGFFDHTGEALPW